MRTIIACLVLVVGAAPSLADTYTKKAADELEQFARLLKLVRETYTEDDFADTIKEVGDHYVEQLKYKIGFGPSELAWNRTRATTAVLELSKRSPERLAKWRALTLEIASALSDGWVLEFVVREDTKTEHLDWIQWVRKDSVSAPANMTRQARHLMYMMFQSYMTNYKERKTTTGH